MEFWQKHSYTSLTVSMETSSSEEEEEGVSTGGDPSEREIRYVVGDVTHPQNAEDADAIVMHCVGKASLMEISIRLIRKVVILYTSYKKAILIMQLGKQFTGVLIILLGYRIINMIVWCVFTCYILYA